MLNPSLAAPESPTDISNAVIHFASNLTNSAYCNKVTENNWLIDSGAICHIATQKHLFQTLEPITNHETVYLPDGSSCLPKFVGKICINPEITLVNVYYIPSFKFNLISVSALIKSNDITPIFAHGKCVLQDQNTKRILEVATQKGNLFNLSCPEISLAI